MLPEGIPLHLMGLRTCSQGPRGSRNFLLGTNAFRYPASLWQPMPTGGASRNAPSRNAPSIGFASAHFAIILRILAGFFVRVIGSGNKPALVGR